MPRAMPTPPPTVGRPALRRADVPPCRHRAAVWQPKLNLGIHCIGAEVGGGGGPVAAAAAKLRGGGPAVAVAALGPVAWRRSARRRPEYSDTPIQAAADRGLL